MTAVSPYRTVHENAAVLADALMENGWTIVLKTERRIGGPDPVASQLFVKPMTRPPRGAVWADAEVRVHTDGRIEIWTAGEEAQALRHLFVKLGLGRFLRGHRTVKELRSLGYDYWRKQPSLGEAGQFDNTVYDDGRTIVLVSRATLADYEGNRAAWLRERLSVGKRGWR
jgi:hypothetical protein